MNEHTYLLDCIVKFHFCRQCGILRKSDKHRTPHFRCNEKQGIIAYFKPDANKIFVAPTFSSFRSMTTYQYLSTLSFSSDCGWMFAGTPDELYDITKRGKDLSLPGRDMSPLDYNFVEVMELQSLYNAWYRAKYL